MKTIISLFFCIGLTTPAFAADETANAVAPTHSMNLNSPVGIWKTIDDKTKAERAIVEIFERDGKIFGRIQKTFPKPEDKPNCEKCPGAEKDKPIVGLEILKNVKKDSDDPKDLNWSGGTILDPNNGENYKVKLELLDDGKKLKVRGYIGFSLLGRTQYWHRH